MAWRFKLAPDNTKIDFFRLQWITFGGSLFLSVLSVVAWAVMGLNYGIDFKGGTTLRTESTVAVDVGAYREALQGLPLGDISITEVFDPNFTDDQHVTMIRIAAEDDAGRHARADHTGRRGVAGGHRPGNEVPQRRDGGAQGFG